MSASRAPAVEIAVRTDPGRDPDKQVNEDSNAFRETKLGMLAVVCDGMGGHAGGKEASELAIKTICEIVDAAPPVTNPGVALKRAIEEANARVWSMPTAEAGAKPGSTVVAILAHDQGAEIAHVGDSRIYLIHAGAIAQITRDHSMVQEMVDRNIIRAEDAAKHPDANKILRALGIAKEVEVELRPQPLAYVNGDVFILCSDGLSDLVEPAEILDIAGSQPPKQAAHQLVDLANARGGHDNITALVVQMKASATVSAAPARHVAKTVPLTAMALPPTVDQHDGPTGTVVGAPMTGTQLQAPLMAPGSHPTPPPPSPVEGRSPMIFIGVLLAIAALFIVGAVVFMATHRTHKAPVILVDAGTPAATVTVTATATATDDAPVPAAPLTTTPFQPSAPFQPAPTLVTPFHDAGSDACDMYQRARDRKLAPGVVSALEKKCRASGGTP